MSLDAAWDFTRRLSVRSHVRGLTGDGYSAIVSLDGPAPVGVWAVHLTDARERFRLLGFDFDAKGNSPEVQGQARIAAQHSAAELVRLLQVCGIEHVVCESGPSGGRHVWVALADPLDVDYVTEVAVTARSVFGRVEATGAWVLDITMLTNRSTGLLRPPGAPHPAGGASTVIAGDPAVLLASARSTTRTQVDELLALLRTAQAALPAPENEPSGRARAVTVAEADDGHAWIPGTRRELAGPALAKVHAPVDADTDASDVLFSILCSCARAHWTFTDVHTRLAGLPGLEHARTRRSKHQPGTREPRPRKGSQSPKQVLAADWRRAIAYLHAHSTASSTADELPEDPDFSARAAAVCQATAAIERAADAQMSRWCVRGGAADRLVLNALCEIADTVVQLTIGADVRTLAEMAGITRERSRNALHRLARDGWITLTNPHQGPHAAVWTLNPPTATRAAANGSHRSDRGGENEPASTDSEESTIRVSLGAIGPECPSPLLTEPSEGPTAGAALRQERLTHWLSRRDLATHDAFTAGARDDELGTWEALVYSCLPDAAVSVEHALPVSTPREVLALAIENLTCAGLIALDGAGMVRRLDESARESYALWIGTTGTLEARKEQHRIERELWAWWLDEMSWMDASTRTLRRPGYRSGRRNPDQRALAVGTVPAWADRARYPRRPGGRRDHRSARRQLTM